MSNNTETTPLVSENPYKNVVVNNSKVKTGVKSELKTTAAQGATDSKKGVVKSLGPHMTPQRTSRTTQKLKLLPDSLDYIPSNETDDDNPSNELLLSNGKSDALKQYSLQKIKDRHARKDAERLGKKHRSMLPRVTTYCTAGSYKMRDLIRWLKDKRRIHSTAPKLFDECIYTPFEFKDWRRNSNSSSNSSSKRHRDDTNENNNANGKINSNNDMLIRIDDDGGEINLGKRSTDLFIFEYGVIVMWGFSKREEKIFLMELARFENEKLADDDVQTEEFNYYITKSYQPRIYNDFISLRDDSNHLLKLSISYAISQSVKISLFEGLVDSTIEDTQDIPQQISATGKVEMTRQEIMKSIGELFILRININLHGSILDSPELMWSEPQLEPIYQATRGYLEINQRVALLNQRLEIISDLLQMLKEQLGYNNDQQLEFIVILLIGAEVVVSIINIIVDIYSKR
ncbi:Rmd1 protein [Martiniozyma asiatica (nom. inval.)]|nr:Rmd1 protein [Martiniozyma asiatica]